MFDIDYGITFNRCIIWIIYFDKCAYRAYSKKAEPYIVVEQTFVLNLKIHRESLYYVRDRISYKTKAQTQDINDSST